MSDKIKDFFSKIVFWWGFFKGSFTNEEILFIDVLYTKGVEAYAWGGKNKSLFFASKHYRKGWSDFEVYEKRVNPRYEDRPESLKQYVTGVAVAYVHGTMLWNTTIAQDISNGTPPSGPAFFAGTNPYCVAGFKNAMLIMDKQQKLMKTDETVQRIKEIHQTINPWSSKNKMTVFSLDKRKDAEDKRAIQDSIKEQVSE